MPLSDLAVNTITNALVKVSGANDMVPGLIIKQEGTLLRITVLIVIVVTTSGLYKGVGKVPKYWEAWVGEDWNWDIDVWNFRRG